MTAIYKTKKEILKLFVDGTPLTLTDISCKLSLSGATVNQHLNELKEMGAIEEVERQGTKKWKYYRLNFNQAEKLYQQWSEGTKSNAFVYNTSTRDSWDTLKQYGSDRMRLLLSKKMNQQGI